MKDFFQRLASPGGRTGTEGVEPRLAVAAFGKHPGWDDHIPGIGLETDVLARIKQVLYVDGIGRQIDTGAWEKLPPDKRVEGFDHAFLWLLSGHLVLGRFWSSVDRKGRSKYPMVICADGEGVAPGQMLAGIPPELERLRGACRSTQEAQTVSAECRTVQERLRAMLAGRAAAPSPLSLSVEMRRRFLERPEFGPDRVGLLRIMHELDNALGNSGRGGTSSSSAKVDLRPCHIRLPLASDSPGEALVLWAAFLHSLLPAGMPVLLISRPAVDWLDAIIGEPESDSFFCLQASSAALPLATQIPYETAPDLKLRLEEREAKFLGTERPAAIREKPTAIAPPPVAASKRADGAKSTAPKRGGLLGKFFGIGAILLAAGAAWWFFAGGSGSTTEGTKPDSNEKKSTSATSQPANPAQSEADYTAAMTAARAAFERKDFAETLNQANVALQSKSGDAAAKELAAEAHDRIEMAAATAQQQEQRYEAALREGRAAFERQDYANAVAQADLALGVKANDPEATKLKNEAKGKMEAVAALEQEYETLIKDANAALERKAYAEVLAKAEAGLKLKPNDSAATKLIAEAKRALAEFAQNEQKYETAMREGTAAFAGKNYSVALAQANVALGIKPDDAAAAKLKRETEARRREIAAEAERESDFQRAIAGAQAAFDRKEYSSVIAQANTALEIKAGDSTATDLKARATVAKDLEEAQAAFEQGQLDKALALTAAHPGNEAFSSLADKIRERKSQQDDQSGKKRLDELDTQLEILLVRFNILRARDPKIRSQAARDATPIVGSISAQREEYLQLVNNLEQQLRAGGWLEAEDRDKNLKRLKEGIRYWP